MSVMKFGCFCLLAGLLGACGGEEGDGAGTRGGGAAFDGTGGDVGATGGLGGGSGTFGNPNGGTTGGGGMTGGGGNGNMLPDGTCDRISVFATKADPEFLIVLDKSGSMGGLDHPACQAAPADCDPFSNPLSFLDARCGNGTYDRWTPSVNALFNITAQLDAMIPFGLMMYPSDNQCGAGDIQVPIGLGTSAAIKGVFDGTCPNGRTPTSAALQAAGAEFMARSGGPDAPAVAPYVLLVTDGAPNCVDGGDSAAEQATWDAVSALAAAGIRTYVIGYDTQNDAGLASVLDEAARRGGTGDQAHRPVEDEASLTSTFQSIAMNAVSCTYLLQEPVTDPGYVRVVLDGGDQINLDDPNGWVLGSDNMSVTLQGDTCNTLQDGGTHSLDITVECELVVPQ